MSRSDRVEVVERMVDRLCLRCRVGGGCEKSDQAEVVENTLFRLRTCDRGYHRHTRVAQGQVHLAETCRVVLRS